MKTTFKYDHYYLYQEMSDVLHHFEEKYPDLCKLDVLCVTEKGLNQYAMKITNYKTGSDEDKPAYYMDGTIHAGEVTASMVCIYTIDYLLTNYGSDEVVTEMLDKQAVYVLPRVSPDGAESYLTTENFMYSADREWKEKYGGLSPEDIDGDGIISLMRVRDKQGLWKKDPADPDLMVLRKPDERHGEFYSLYPEGSLEMVEGMENIFQKKMKWSMNFNRNFPFGWCPDPREIGAGDYPFSFPEIKAQGMFIMGHKNIGAVSALHTTAGMILFPPGTKPEAKGNQKDMLLYRSIGEMGTEETGYPCVNIFDAFLADQENFSSGALDDWCYQGLGIPAYTVELWDLADRAGAPEDMTARITGGNGVKQERYAKYVKWIKENAPEAFRPWEKFNHPQLGEVELGGYAYKFTQQNPPAKFLLQECEKICRFMIRFANCLPRLEIESVSSSKIMDGLYEVSATVMNTGYMSTNLCEEAKVLQTNTPVCVKISTSDLLKGEELTEIGDLAGFNETKTSVFYGQLYTRENSKSRKKLVWHVKGNAGDKITISVSHVKSGHDEAVIEL